VFTLTEKKSTLHAYVTRFRDARRAKRERSREKKNAESPVVSRGASSARRVAKRPSS